jgi:CBS domain-containing protein
MRTIQNILDSKRKDLWSVSPDATVYDALVLMSEKNIGALPVVENGRLEGIISERDYARKVILKGKTSRDLQVSEIMTRDVVTINPGQSVYDAMKLMSARQIRHLPVVPAGAAHPVVGIVSITDIVREIIDDKQSEIDQLSNYITGKL